ncbi:competence protein ComK [Sediminibacillus massiliensis]|uniref:competence protein ComK n=1 Tax=Sediminibacillus massiliensis TaxID=1926277 RepID=UPI0009885C91|nr:competence protein ComK [Sediminibacillus massiliensis]
MEIKKQYEVNPFTLAVLSEEFNGKYLSRIMEDDEVIFVEQPPSKVIDLACKYFGSSLRGRQDGTKDIFKVTHKAPISIDPSSGMYFFPTTSPNNPQCNWIAHSHIDQVVKAPNQSSQIIFTNGKSVTLDVSYGSLLNQVQRTAQFRYLLDHRIKYVGKNNHAEIVAEPFA